MTLAYVFWHQSRRGVDATSYEEALLRFHSGLAERPVAGLAGSHTVRIPTTPWLAGGGYEDWYFVDDFAALGALNGAAVDAAHARAHDAAASLAGFGTAGLYRLIGGDVPAGEISHHYWFAKRHPLPDPGQGALWQRQLTLGPAPEFCLVSPEPPAANAAVSVVDDVIDVPATPIGRVGVPNIDD